MENIFKLMKETASVMRAPAAKISSKGRGDFVTEVDVAVQEAMRKGLAALYPDYGFLSEEQENHPDLSKPIWILDPIDGTANFITQYHQSAISLALWKEGKIVFGAVYNPFTEELFSAEKGRGAFCNGEPIGADQETPFADALIALGTMPYYKDRAEEVGHMAAELIRRAADIRRIGSASLALCYTAAGRTGGFLEGILQPWDFAAGLLIAQEAGAEISDWAGNPLRPLEACSVAAGGKKVYPELMELIKEGV